MRQPSRRAIILGATVAAAVTVSTPRAQEGRGAQYVSMGSSYAAGPGIGEPDAASGACGRSRSNYARLLAEQRGLSLVDVACSGATTRDILDRSATGLAPQLDAVELGTRLVTVTIGGNDVGYVANLFGYSCRDTGGTCPVASDAEVDERFAALPDSLRSVVAEVRRRAPRARLVLIGYLPVAPESDAADCPAVPLSAPDRARMRAVLQRLSSVLHDVAAETRTLLLPASELGAGHEACSPAPYVAGYKPPLTPGWPHAVGYHPNQAGMRVLADALDRLVPVDAARP